MVAIARGLCMAHYQRQRRGTSLYVPLYHRTGYKGECKLDKCEKEADTYGGACKMHKMRMWRHGSYTKKTPRRGSKSLKNRIVADVAG